MAKMKVKTLEQFRKTLATGVKQLRQGKANVWDAAKFGIFHYDKCGDHGPLNEVLGALRTQAGVGASAFVKWVEKYTDQVWDKEALKLVRHSEAQGKPSVDLEAAFSENFWNTVKIAQEAELVGEDEFFTDIHKIVKRYQNENRKKASDPTATKAVEDTLAFVRAKAPRVVLAA